MTTADWHQMDPNAGHDLFGGDLFGDELIDIYNSAVVVEGGTTDVNASGEFDSSPSLFLRKPPWD